MAHSAKARLKVAQVGFAAEAPGKRTGQKLRRPDDLDILTQQWAYVTLGFS
jgi:hypothetical protein